MKRVLFICILFISLMLNLVGQSNDALLQKSYVGGLHFAGNSGLVSIIIGKKFFKNIMILGAGYGYLPKSVNGVEAHSILLKTNFNFSKGLINKQAYWYAGFTTIYAFTSNTFFKLPARYPNKYYAPIAIHFAPYLGLRTPFFFFKPIWASKVYLHTELGTLDSYLYYYILNKKVNFWDICNVSMGLYFDL